MKEIQYAMLRPGDYFEHLGQRYFVLENRKSRVVAISASGGCRLTLPYEEKRPEEAANKQLEIDCWN